MQSYHLATLFPWSYTKLFPLLGVLLLQKDASSFTTVQHFGWVCSCSYKYMFTNMWNELEYRYHMFLTTQVFWLNVCKLSSTYHRKVINHITYQSMFHFLFCISYSLSNIMLKWSTFDVFTLYWAHYTSNLLMLYFKFFNHFIRNSVIMVTMLMLLLWIMLSVYTLTILTFTWQGWRCRHFRARFVFTGL